MNKLLKRFPALMALMLVALLAMSGQALAQGGPIVLSGDDSDDSGHCRESRCGQLIGKTLSFIVNNSQSSGSGILAIGVNSSNALSALNGWNTPTHAGPNVAITHARTATEIANANFSDYAMIYIPSDSRNTRGGITSAQMTALNARQADIATFVNNNGGGLFALTEGGLSNRYGWLPVPLTVGTTGHSTNILPTPDMNTIAPGATGLSHCCYHNTFTGPAGFSGLKVLAYHDHNSNGQFDGRSVDHVIMLGGVQVTIQGTIDLAPPNATLTVGDQHTVTATAEDGDPLAPVSGALVTFAVSGANAGASGTCVPASCETDANGQVTFTYTGNNEGTDNISASFVDGNGTTQTSQTVNAEWEVPADTEPPVITAPPNVDACNDPGQASAVVTFPAATATDNSGSATVVQTSGPASGSVFPLGTTVITWTATDAAGNSASASMTVTVSDCEPPVITTSDITAEATGPLTPVDVAAVTSATDNVGVVSLTNDNAGPYPLGPTTVTWTACDAAGNCSNATQVVTIEDTTPPDLTNACLKDTLWPPNHKLHLAVTGSATDLFGVTVTVDVTSNQPLNGTGDGNTDSDWHTVVNPDGSYSVELRAERAGNIGQRDYTVTVTATDGNGNVSTETCTSSVPHDQGNNNSPASKKGKK